MGAIRSIYVWAVFLMMGFGYAQEYDTIPWNPGKKLNWNDFKAAPPQGERVAAVTASGITYAFSSLRGKDRKVRIDFTVSTFFYPNKSWYRPKLCDTFILAHEQLHFDISELFARKMRKRLGETNFSENVKAEVRAIYKKIIKELEAYQNRYDSETNFSRNREQQLLWNEKVRKALRG